MIMITSMSNSDLERARVTIRGAVQGVGFRPFVYRLARALELKGWVSNSSQGVFIEIEGTGETVRRFLLRLEKERPPRAIIQSLEFSFLDPVGFESFDIHPSDQGGLKTTLILPDIATCPDCLHEILDPTNRRYRYPFTNCTNCGPRFTIIESLPYDRPNTSMRCFTMCPDCAREYGDPLDRRFDAQPIACPRCGPQLELWDKRGLILEQRDEALRQAADFIRQGKIVAVKGMGGFQLLVDARNQAAIMRLRVRKHREEKPFALMYVGIDAVHGDCHVSELEERLLLSPEAPIVLLKRRSHAGDLATELAPGNPYLGVMLPCTPLHHLLLREIGFPVVATSGNLSDEPICIDERDAVERLGGIADLFLVHNRPIVRHVDDSVVRVIMDRELVLRRARGYAPLPIHLKESVPSILAVGAHLKNSVALSVGTEVFLSQHIGDLETSQAFSAFRRVSDDFQRLYEATPEAVACDLHPEYLSTKHAMKMGIPVCPVQHHWAHVLSCIAENEIEPPALGVSWDGTGLGSDGTIWGGEFLLAGGEPFERVAHLRPFRLPGGEAAIRQPARSALGLLFEMWGSDAFERRDLAPVQNFPQSELVIIRRMLEREVNAPVTSSAGRLFDAVASLLGLRQRCGFEGQAAMEMEFAVRPGISDVYPFRIHEGIVDWQPMIEAIISSCEDKGAASAKFHNTLAEMVVAVARETGEEAVVLTGGCFQNSYLTTQCVQRLRLAGFRPYWHQRVPPNDGGIALGQIIAASRTVRPVSMAKEGALA
jgi:hydrogenase maturation protein HypF